MDHDSASPQGSERAITASIVLLLLLMFGVVTALFVVNGGGYFNQQQPSSSAAGSSNEVPLARLAKRQSAELHNQQARIRNLETKLSLLNDGPNAHKSPDLADVTRFRGEVPYHAGNSEKFTCDYSGVASPEDVAQAREVFEMARLRRGQALNGLSQIKDRAFREHVLVYHVLDLLQTKSDLERAIQLLPAVQDLETRYQGLALLAAKAQGLGIADLTSQSIKGMATALNEIKNFPPQKSQPLASAPAAGLSSLPEVTRDWPGSESPPALEGSVDASSPIAVRLTAPEKRMNVPQIVGNAVCSVLGGVLFIILSLLIEARVKCWLWGHSSELFREAIRMPRK